MAKVKEWRNVSASISVEVGKDEDGQWIDVDGESLPESVAKELEPLFPGVKNEDAYAELVIDFTSSGYYDPGRTYGDPFYCYPPEGDDERLLDGKVGIWLHIEKKSKPDHCLSEKASDDLFEAYRDEIESKEVDHSDEY